VKNGFEKNRIRFEIDIFNFFFESNPNWLMEFTRVKAV